MQQTGLLELRDVVLREGFDPAGQLAGYLQTGDPTYLPPGLARGMARRLEHDVLLRAVVEWFLRDKKQPR